MASSVAASVVTAAEQADYPRRQQLATMTATVILIRQFAGDWMAAEISDALSRRLRLSE